MATDGSADGPQSYPEPLQDPAAWLSPFDWYREMREDRPVRYDLDRGAWDVFRYDDAREVFGDAETFSSDPATADWHDDAPQSPLGASVISTDPPRHAALRSAVEGEFRSEAVADLEPRVRALARELLDEALDGSDDGGGFDFVGSLAEPLPVAVVAELLGVPADDRERFRRWTGAVLALSAGDSAASDAEARRRRAAMGEMTDYVRDALAERRANPRDDLLTTVATAGADLSAREMLGFWMLMLVGGTVTTRNLLANVLWTLGERPSLLSACAAGERSVGPVVEETLRYRSPIQALSRYATGPATLRGREIAPGDTVVVWMGSANRDRRRFDAPGEFRPDRSPNPHLGFGHGTHYCLGAPLARLEARVAFEELFDRLSGIEVDTDELTPVRKRGKFLYGVETLPVRGG